MSNSVEIFHGDCRQVMAEFAAHSVDAIVTDPPYELGFMGKGWDSSGIAYDPTVWAEAYRVLKPGGHLLAFGGTRTWHRLAVAIEDAGFEVRDSIAWMYGSGFPKSLDVSKAIEKAAPITAPATPAAQQWQGWGTALKPAFEPIVVARKPLIGTVAENVLKHGTGALNIDGCRIDTNGESWDGNEENAHNAYSGQVLGKFAKQYAKPSNPNGRWPANVILDESQAAELDKQTGVLTSGKMLPTHTTAERKVFGQNADGGYTTMETYGDTGGASRFFYTAKASKKERPNVDGIAHPTVKPLKLMEYLVRLVTPPGGTVLDPFAGSGTMIEAAVREGFDVIGIELTDEYLPLIQERLDRADGQGRLL